MCPCVKFHLKCGPRDLVCIVENGGEIQLCFLVFLRQHFVEDDDCCVTLLTKIDLLLIS